MIKSLTNLRITGYLLSEMIKKSVKLAEIAEKTGVSIATASMVLTGKGRISEEVRTKVILAAREMGYKKKNTIPGSSWGLLIPMEDFWDNVWHFMKPAMHNILKTAISQNIKYSIVPVYENYSADHILDLLQGQNINAVFAFHCGKIELFKHLEENNIQVVVINNSQFQEGYYSVCVDDFQGAYEGTKHLIEKNHTRIAYIDYPIEILPSLSSDRYFGFRKAVEEAGIGFPEEWHLTVKFEDIPEIKARLYKTITASPAPTAFFVHDDILANRVIHLLEELGKKVPEDCSIVAPGDTLNYSYPETPQITTMSINTGLMGKYAAEMMLERNRGNYSESHVLKIKQQLIIRGSTLSI